MDNADLITIAIITRNRLENLHRFLKSLSSSAILKSVSDVIIIDNCSDYDEDQVSALVDKYLPNIPHRIVRNKLNYGASVNVLKAFEYAKAKYILPMGDSKVVNQSFKIDANLYATKPAFVNYHLVDKFHSKRKNTSRIENHQQYFNEINSFGDILLYGNTVYSRDHLQDALHKCWRFLDSHCTQVILQLEIINNGGIGYFSKDQILSHMLEKPKDIEDLSLLECTAGFTKLFEVVDPKYHNRVYDLIFGQKSIYPIKYLIASIMLEPKTASHRARMARINYYAQRHSKLQYISFIFVYCCSHVIPRRFVRFFR